MSLGYSSQAARVTAFGLAVVAVLLAASAPVEAQTVNYIEGAWATSGGTNPTFVATGSDTNISIILTPKGTGGVGIGTTSPNNPLDLTQNFGSVDAILIHNTDTVDGRASITFRTDYSGGQSWEVGLGVDGGMDCVSAMLIFVLSRFQRA
jgi:hypothetical protein